MKNIKFLKPTFEIKQKNYSQIIEIYICNNKKDIINKIKKVELKYKNVSFSKITTTNVLCGCWLPNKNYVSAFDDIVGGIFLRKDDPELFLTILHESVHAALFYDSYITGWNTDYKFGDAQERICDLVEFIVFSIFSGLNKDLFKLKIFK